MLANNDLQKLYSQIKQKSHIEKLYSGHTHSRNLFSKIKIINLVALVILSILVTRLLYLNTIDNQFLTKQLDSRTIRTVKINAMRGNIVDRNNIPLAVSTPVSSIWLDPSQIDNLTRDKLNTLALILGLSINELNKKMNAKDKSFIYLKRGVTPDQANQIKNLKINGIYFLQEYKRYYPYADITSHIIGFNNVDDVGVEGVEFANNSKLFGYDGLQQIIKDRQNNVIEHLGILKAPNNGKNVQLALDTNIQSIAYSALKSQVLATHAAGGSVVVLDAKTAEVLAMVNMPSYNPNNRNKISLDTLRNKATVDIYEPGSIIKPLLIAKALDLGIVNVNSIFDTKAFIIGKKLIQDDHPYNSMNVREIIQHSSDVGSAKIGLKLNKNIMWKYYNDIGFGNKINVHFPGEAKGILRNYKSWYPLDQAEMSFGYGISVSLLQMAQAYTIFTNNGCLLPVTLYKKDDNITCKQLISPKIAQEMQNILVATTVEGTGQLAQIQDYTTAGKTGTAQKYSKVNGYKNHQYYASFVGYAPSKNPKLIIAVTIDNPRKGSYYGATVATPVFATTALNSLHQLDIKPDKK